MKLFRNAVFAVKRAGEKEITAFLYVNHKGNISPFWHSEHHKGGWFKAGWISGDGCGYWGGCWGTEDDDAHNHWYGVETDGHEIIMIQSHVTHANQVNMKLCRKIVNRTKS